MKLNPMPCAAPRTTWMKLRHSSHSAARGFTLIEAMIVVAIVAILAVVAFPTYTEHIRKARRSDAKSALLDLAAREERFHSVQNVYTQLPSDLGYTATTTATFPIDVFSGSTAFYELSVTITAATSTAGPTFVATATAKGRQAGDKCGDFTLNHLGVQTVASAATTAADCW